MEAVIFLFPLPFGIGGARLFGRTFVPMILPKQSGWLEAFRLLISARYVVLWWN
jgi:hypothetical protein